MKTNLFSKIKTFLQNRFAKKYPSMTKENTTTDSHRRTRIWNHEFFQTFLKGIVHGFGIMLGIFGTGLLLAVPSGVSSPWASGDKLTAAGLNALRTAIEGIPNWTKNGTNAYYTDGNVGIGTSNPGYKLSIQNGNISLWDNKTSYPTSLPAYGNYIRFSQHSLNYSSADIGVFSNSTFSHEYLNGSGLFFRTKSFDNNPEIRMVIDGNGNVGIGNSAPTELLQIGDLSNTPEGRRAISLGGSGFGEPGPENSDSNGDKIIFFNNSTGSFKSDFRMGIGYTASFWSKAPISGSFKWFAANVQKMMLDNPSGNLWIAGSLSQNSDLRKKRQISELVNSLDTLNKLKPLKYYWKKEHSSDQREQYGFIAQDVEKILPSIVSTDNKGYKSINYISIIPFLVESIKSISIEKNNQNISIEKLKEENSALSSRYSSLLYEQNSLKKEIEELSLRYSSVTDTLKTVNEENRELKKQLSILRKENSEKLSSLEERLKVMENLQLVRK